MIITGGLAQGELRDIVDARGHGHRPAGHAGARDLQELPSVMRPVAGLPLLYLEPLRPSAGDQPTPRR